MDRTALFDEDRKYSLNRIIRLMSEFPEDRPLPCRYEHGHTPLDYMPANYLKTKKQLMLVYNKRRREIWQRYSKKKAVIVGSPFVQYRRLKNISVIMDFAPSKAAMIQIADLSRGFTPIQENNLKRAFQVADRGSSGGISVGELKEVLKAVDELSVTSSHAKSMFAPYLADLTFIA